MRFSPEVPLALHQRQVALLEARPRAAARAALRSALRPCAPRSGSRWCRGPAGAPARRISSGRSARSVSITPKLTPLPPCTATPAGLSSTRSRSSSWTIGRADALAERRRGLAGLEPPAAGRTGGMRILSSTLRRVSGSGALAVHAHLALADDAVDAAARDAAQALAARSCPGAVRPHPRSPRSAGRRCASGRLRGSDNGTLRCKALFLQRFCSILRSVVRRADAPVVVASQPPPV